jgi:hypothetical protein
VPQLQASSKTEVPQLLAKASPEELQGDPEVVRAAVAAHPASLTFASDDLQEDRPFILSLVTATPGVWRCVNKRQSLLLGLVLK